MTVSISNCTIHGGADAEAKMELAKALGSMAEAAKCLADTMTSESAPVFSITQVPDHYKYPAPAADWQDDDGYNDEDDDNHPDADQDADEPNPTDNTLEADADKLTKMVVAAFEALRENGHLQVIFDLLGEQKHSAPTT